MKKTSSTLFVLLGTIVLTCMIVPASLYAQGHRDHFNLYMKLGNSDRQLIGAVDTELTDSNNEAPNRQTRYTQITINPGWRWLTNSGYLGEHEVTSLSKEKVTWAKSPSRLYRYDSRFEASSINFTTETHNAGATSFALRYSGNHHMQGGGGDFFYTYIMREEGHSQPYCNEVPEVASQAELNVDFDEGYHSLQSLEDLGATALDPYSVPVTTARLSIIDLYFQSSGVEGLGSWFFNHYFDESNPGANSLEERVQAADKQNHQPATEQSNQVSSEPKKTVFFDIWSLFENRMLVHQLISENRYSVFLVSPHLGTNPVMLSNSGLELQAWCATFSLLSALQDPWGRRPLVGSINLTADHNLTLESVQMRFITNTNKRVQIELERVPDSGGVTTITTSPALEQTARNLSPPNDEGFDGMLREALQQLGEPKPLQNQGIHPWF